MKKLTISILLSLIASLSVLANEIDIDSIYLDEVTVMASSRPKQVILPQRLSGSELHTLSALNVADALRYFSGVQLKDYGGVGGIKTINIRSMGSQHVGVYYNGIQIGNAQNGVVDLGKFAMDELEAIELYNGQKSDIFQSAREMGNAGSIYLQSRKPHFTSSERIHARASMRTGSFGLANPSVSLDINLSPSIRTAKRSTLNSQHSLFLTMNASYLRSDGQYPFRYRRLTPSGTVAYDTTAYRHNSDIQAVRAEIGLHHYYSASGYWRLQGYTYWSERGVPGAIVNNVWSNGERLEDRNSFAQFQWQDNFFHRYHIRLLAKYANDYTHYRNLDTRTLPTNNTYLQQEVYASLIQQVNILPAWDISVAYDLQYNDLTRQQGISGMPSSPKEHYNRWSHFCSIATAFNVQSYLRVQASALLTHINSNTKLTPAVFVSLSPLASISSPYAKALTINAFYKHSYRYPTFNDLYYTDVGNAALRPELARQASVGLRYEINLPTSSLSECPEAPLNNSKLSTLNVSLDYYHNRVTDKIIAFPKGQQFRWAMLNLGEVLINGIDASVGATIRLPLRFTLTPRVQYTYQQAIDVTSPNDSYYRHQIPYIPHHSVSAVSGLTYTSRRADTYGLNYSFIYVGERYSQQENIPANYVPAWTSHDLTIYGEWNIQTIRLHAQLEINNLAGTDYEVIMNYPMPQTSFRATLSIIY